MPDSWAQAFKETQAIIEQWHETQKQFADIAQTIRDEWADLAKQNVITIDIQYDKLYLAATKMGERGWTIPFELTLRNIYELGDTELSEHDIDDAFFKFYVDNNKEEFSILVNHIATSNLCSSWRELFKQCVKAYNDEQYLIVIPSLLTILEGLLATLLSNKGKTKMADICISELGNYETDEGKFVNRMAWLSITSFIQNLYAGYPFSGDEPSRINRHWILHGRSVVNWTSIDCLRLFNAISSVISVLKHKESPE